MQNLKEYMLGGGSIPWVAVGISLIATSVSATTFLGAPADVYGDNITKRQRELMTADLIFTAILLSPSNTSSLSQSHNGYQKTVGAEQDFYQDDKIKYAIRIYNIYGDERAEILESVKRKIRFIPIEDVDRL